MGAKRKNFELVTDYADGRNFIRLHRDIELPEDVCNTIRKLLGTGNWEEAKSLALDHAPVDAREELVMFFDATAALCTC